MVEQGTRGRSSRYRGKTNRRFNYHNRDNNNRPHGNNPFRNNINPLPPQNMSTPPPLGNGVVDPFELFCSLNLGITHDNQYRPQSMHDIARRFGVSLQELKEKITQFGLDAETIKASGFDLEMAQLDIRVVPEGISRKELAKNWYEEYRQLVPLNNQPPAPSVTANKLNELTTPIFDDEA